MPRKKNTIRKIGKHTQEEMKIALNLIKDGKKIRQAARETNIPFTTLQRYYKKLCESSTEENVRLVPNYCVNMIFSAEEEKILKDYFRNCANLFYGLTIKECRQVAYEMAQRNNKKIPISWHTNQMAGRDWLRSFRSRHPDLSLRKPEACSLARASAFRREAVEVFFSNVENVIKRSPAFANGARIFNLDETGTTTVQKPQKVLGRKGQKNICKVTSQERGVLCTTCCIISAGGIALPPVIIYPRKNINPRMNVGTPPGTLVLANPSGWMNSELFSSVMEHFIKHSHSSPDSPSILILDNHESHLSIEALDIAKNSGVNVVTLPPHTSAKLQPLDVGIFGPFKTYYDNAMDSWLMRHPGCPVTIYDVGGIIAAAFTKSMTPSNIINAFRKTGIFPFDKNIFNDEDFLPSTVTDHSNLKSTDATWQQTESSIQTVTVDIHEPPRDRPIPGSCITDQISPSQHTVFKSPPASQDLEEIIEATSSPGMNRDTIAGTSGIQKQIITPEQFRQPLQAGPTNRRRRSRKLGKSIIATDGREEIEIAAKHAAKTKTNMKGKRVVRQVWQSDSDDDDYELPYQHTNDDDNWIENDEEEGDENAITEIFLEKNPLPRNPEEGDYVLVLFCTKRQKVYYVAKVLQAIRVTQEYNVSFLRLKIRSRHQFCIPDIPDLSFVQKDDIKFILPKPIISGSAKRQSYYKFPINLSLLNIR